MKTFAAAAFTTVALVAGAAQAAPQIVGSHYQETVSVICNNSTNCQVPFASIPVGKGLLVTRVDCRATVPNPVEVFQVTLLSFGANAMFVATVPTVNMYASAATKFTTNCTISGTIKPLASW